MFRFLLVAALIACSHSASPSPKAPSTPSSPASDIAPQLFTLEELRAGNAAGRVIELRIEIDGKPPMVNRMEFVASTADEATIRSTTTDEAGTVLEDATAPAKWSEIYKHGQFPASATTIEDNVQVTVPAGSFKTRLYTVIDGTSTRRFWFSSELPGPPVQFTTEEAGKVVMRAVMLRAR